MVPQAIHPAAAPLKAITSRIAATPTDQLPRIVPHLAQSLWNCKSLLSAPDVASRKDNDAAIILHRFKTQLSTLLQDRTVQGRWTAVVLVKATIEAGGWEVLSKCNAWVRSLLAILKKPDPPTTRKLCVITLTRIFMLTRDYPTLLREITTPALPNFVAICLSNAYSKRCSPSELQTVLESFAHLIPRHPTIFRTQESQLHSLLVNVISSSASAVSEDLEIPVTEAHKAIAQRVLVLLHHCEPKQGSSEKWDGGLKAAIASAHAVTDQVFRSVIEDWQSTTNVISSRPSASGDVEQSDLDAVGLSGWKGIYAGSERLVTLLGLLQSHITTTTASSVNVRIGLIADLLTRLLSLTVPRSDTPGTVRANTQISKDEREALWAVLPGIHTAALELVMAMLDRFSMALLSVWQNILDQTTWVFDAEKSDTSIRTIVYLTVARLLELFGRSLGKDSISSLASLIKACCEDLVPTETKSSAQRNGTAALSNGHATPSKQQSGNADTLLARAQTSSSSSPAFPELHHAASSLLPVLLSSLPTKHMPPALRTRMDQTAILTQHKDAMLASVLNPAAKGDGRVQRSIMPLLARAHAGTREVEALLRPRMPVIRTGRRGSEGRGQDEEEEEEEEEAEEEEHVDGADGADVGEGEGDGDHLDQLESAVDGFATQPAAVDESHPQASEQTAQQAIANKRIADNEAIPPPPKRFRASPVAETLLPEAAQELPGTDPEAMQADVPKTVVADQSNSPASGGPEAVATLPAGISSKGTDFQFDESDIEGSDFEMPPLTMESSDEEEEEEGEEEEGA